MPKQNERNAGRKRKFEGKVESIQFLVPTIHKSEIKEKVYKILDGYKKQKQ